MPRGAWLQEEDASPTPNPIYRDSYDCTQWRAATTDIRSIGCPLDRVLLVRDTLSTKFGPRSIASACLAETSLSKYES